MLGLNKINEEIVKEGGKVYKIITFEKRVCLSDEIVKSEAILNNLRDVVMEVE